MLPIVEAEGLQGKEHQTIDHQQNRTKDNELTNTQGMNRHFQILSRITGNKQFQQIRLDGCEKCHGTRSQTRGVGEHIDSKS